MGFFFFYKLSTHLGKTGVSECKKFFCRLIYFFLALGFSTLAGKMESGAGAAEATLAVLPALKRLFERPAGGGYGRFSCHHLRFSGVNVSSSRRPERSSSSSSSAAGNLPEFRRVLIENLATVDADANAAIVRRCWSVSAGQSFTSNSS